MKTFTESNRLDYLDAVRTFALILGIVFHASLSFAPFFIGWAVMDVSTSSIVSIFMLISHSFRMELFFLIAGFFSHMTFHGKGLGAFLKSRLSRIAIPFVIGWFILRPLIVASWVIGGESMRGEVNILNSLKVGFATLGDLPKDLLSGSHLWFLYYLLLITASTLALRALAGLHKPTRHKLAQWADTLACWISNSRLALLTVPIPTAACLWFMSHWGMDTPDKGLSPNYPVSLVYGGFFIFGWLLNRQRKLIAGFARLSWAKFALCLAAIIATALLAGFERQPGNPQYTLIKAIFMMSYATMMWSLIALTIGLFKRFFDRPSNAVRFIADSSYWLYLIHLPIVVCLQVAVAELSLHWSIKLVAISAITVAISILIYDLVVRSTIIGKVLNGRRKPRLLFSSRARSKQDPKTNDQLAATEAS